jgi:uncharacterized protein GlcG (DUF336 family)
MSTLTKSSVLVLSLVAGLASAQSVRTEKNMSLELANQIASATVAADNAGPHTLEASRLKAYTSASAKNTTLAMMEGAQKNPAAANLVHIPGYLLLGGGVPVKVGNEVIGAVGVGGAPGGHLDEQCAVAAIAKVQDQLK